MNTDRIGALVTALPWAIAGALLLAVLWAATHRDPPPSRPVEKAHDVAGGAPPTPH